MAPTRTAASRKATSTKQASIGDYFTTRSGVTPQPRQRETEPDQREEREQTPPPVANQREEKEPTPAETVFPTYPLVEGLSCAGFDDERWAQRHNKYYRKAIEWDHKYHKAIGTKTREISLGSSFIVTDKHLYQVAALSPVICKHLRRFMFSHNLHNYDGRNCAKGVTDAGIMRLAAACPNLHRLELPGANGHRLTDAALIFLLEHCPKMLSINFMSTRSDGSVVDALRHRADLAPKLHALYLANTIEVGARGRKALESVRELSRVRPKLEIILFEQTREKNRGKWVTAFTPHVYMNGTEGWDYSAWDN